jgi:hypothetical protein
MDPARARIFYPKSGVGEPLAPPALGVSVYRRKTGAEIASASVRGSS